ncbi:MAG: hypothetical protein LBU19_11615 [Treponema sp.]|jgi:hypothetical protein|nr:hypothetical protein [Treponema sp.]
MAPKQPASRSTERIPWHPAFFDAIRLELEAYRNILEFEFEHQLTEEPLKMDVLIIKKLKDAVIGKNIAAIFRGDNIIEYKSPGDYISVEDFYKVYGYACFYASLNKKDISALTISFVGKRYPRELIQHLKGPRGYRVEKAYEGIYYVKGDIIPIQIIETKKLSPRENLWLNGLSNDLDISRADAIIKESERKGKGAQIRAYLNAVLLANPRVLEETVKMRDGTLTLEKVLKKAGLTEKWKAEGEALGEARGEARGEVRGEARGEARGKEEKALEIAQNLVQKGWSAGEIAEVTRLSIRKVKSLYDGEKRVKGK